MKNKLLKNFVLVGVLLTTAKLVGFIREIIIANKLGTTVESDIYLQTFAIAALIFTAFGMAVSHINIPNMTMFILKKNTGEKNEYVNSLYTSFFIAGLIAVILLSFFSSGFIKLILPGLNPADKPVAEKVFVIMLPTLVFISFTYITTSILQAHKRFVATTIIGLPFNFLIIAYLLIADTRIETLALVTTLGWLLQFLIQLPFLLRENYALRPSFKKNKYVTDIFRRLLPIVIANAVIQICIITDQAFANTAGEGLTSSLRYGSNLFSTITSVFIIGISTVSFPDLSGYNLQKKYEQTRNTLLYIFKLISFIAIPYLAIVLFYGEDLIRIIYMRGEFNENSAIMTALGFSLYSFLIFGYLSQEVFTRLFYSMKEYRTPLLAGLGCMILNFLLTLAVGGRFGVEGIILTTVFVMTLYGFIMIIFTTKHIGGFLGKNFLFYLFKILPGGLLMILAWFVMGRFKSLEESIYAIIKIPAALLVYIIYAYLNGTFKMLIKEKTKERSS